MPVSSATRLAPHFTAGELGADRPEAAPFIVANLTTVAQFLEIVRSELGVPLQVNTPSHPNRGFAPRPDNPTSSHPLGLAADTVPLGYDGGALGAYNALREAKQDGRLPPFDQIILYPFNGFVHIGLGARLRGEFRVHLYEGQGGTPLVPDAVARLGSTSPWVLVAILALGLLFLLV